MKCNAYLNSSKIGVVIDLSTYKNRAQFLVRTDCGDVWYDSNLITVSK